jgi:isocitrate dehydrogenase kinase/phosphatase
VRLCQKVYKLVSELEKNKLLAEKKEYKESLLKKKQQQTQMVDALENFYKNMIGMLKEKIENERMERRIA